MVTIEVKRKLLRGIIHKDSPSISDVEVDEILDLIDIIHYFEEYDCSGNFILSKEITDRDEAITHMCCGIFSQDYELKSGEKVYFAFDYGH